MSLWIAGASFVFLLYSRIGLPEALTQETRARIHAYLAAHPGAGRREMCAALGVHPMTLVHHLHLLTSLGLVVARREGREILYHIDAAPPSAHPVLRAEPRRALARLMLDGARTQRELSEATGYSQRLVAYHLARMNGVLEVNEARPRRYKVRGEVAMPDRIPASDVHEAQHSQLTRIPVH